MGVPRSLLQISHDLIPHSAYHLADEMEDLKFDGARGEQASSLLFAFCLFHALIFQPAK